MSSSRFNSESLSSSVIERALEVEHQQHSYGKNFVQYLEDFGVGVDDIKKSADVIDIRADSRDDGRAIVVHQPLGNPLKAHRLVGVASLAHMFPHQRVISFSNSGHPGDKHKRISIIGLMKIARGSLTDYMSYVEEYIVENGIERVVHIGESLGADLATEAASQKQYVNQGVVALDPASPSPSKFKELTSAFDRSNEAFRGYLHGNDQELSATAFDVAGDGDRYSKGLLRPTNLAFVRMLMKGEYQDRVSRALQNGADVLVARATDSEVCLANPMKGIVGSLQAQDLGNSAGTIGSIDLQRDRHAYPNDLALVNAITAQAYQDFGWSQQ